MHVQALHCVAGDEENPSQCPATGLLVLFEKLAATDRFDVIVKVQTDAPPLPAGGALPNPKHAPSHSMNVDGGTGVAVNVTTVPAGKLSQLSPQKVPRGETVTVPLPVPDVPTVKLNS